VEQRLQQRLFKVGPAAGHANASLQTRFGHGQSNKLLGNFACQHIAFPMQLVSQPQAVSMRMCLACFCFKLYVSGSVSVSVFWGHGSVMQVRARYSLSSSISTRFSSSEVLFWRRSSFCFGWQRGRLGAQSPWAFSLQMRHRNPWRVWPASGGVENVAYRD